MLIAMLERIFSFLLPDVPSPIPMVLYTRKDCGLCDKMKAEIELAVPREPYSLTLVDVDSDPELAREFGSSVPVLWIAGRLAFKGLLTVPEFRRKFERLGAEFRRAQLVSQALTKGGRKGS
jgi:hypothetical protein